MIGVVPAATHLKSLPHRSYPALVAIFAIMGWLAGCATAPVQHRAEAAKTTAAAVHAEPAPSAFGSVEPPPIPVVRLRGTPEEIGQTHGRELSSPIHLLMEQYLDVRMGDLKRRFVAMQMARTFEPYIDPAHKREMYAVASGAGVDGPTILLAQCFLDLTSSIACSTVALPADASPDGIARMGRNLDFPSLNVADKTSAVLVYEHSTDGRYGFAAIGWPGMVGVLSGMNEHGLTLANMEVKRTPRYPSAMPYTLLYRTVLEKCRTVDDAIELLRSSKRQSANNLMLMDADGNRAVVEITPEAIAVRRGLPGQALISTNHQRGEDQDTPARCRRYDCLHDRSAEQFGHIGPAEIRDMLAEASQVRLTIQSMIFEPSTRTVYLATGANAAKTQTFYRLRLGELFR